jgi:hypothetical protein
VFTKRFTAILVGLLLTGCGAGQGAQTSVAYMPVDGVQGASADVKVRNVVLVDINGTLVLVGTAVTSAESADRITGVLINGAPMSISPAAPVLENGTPVTFGGQSATANALLTSATLRPGQHAKVTFTFESAGDIEVTALVRQNDEEFAGITVPSV